MSVAGCDEADPDVELTTLHRNVLDQVFGLTEGAPPERFLVGIAALDLVATAAKKQPIVWLVDDAQWIDQASMQAIGFVGRRLLAERVAILIATRDVSDENELAGLPELRIGGLNTEDAGRLFDSVVSGPMDPLVRDRVISETRGNPLALLELPRAWTTAELVEGLSESAGIPLTGRLEFAFAKRLRELPPDTQTLLALAAAEPTGDPALLWSAAQRLGMDWSLDDTGAEINTVEADASSPEDLRARMTELYSDEGAPGVVIYNAVLGAPDQLLSSTVTHLQEAYAVDVIGAIVVAQEAAPAMKAAGFGTMIVTGGGFADHPIPALATVSLGKAALRSAATMLGADLGPDGIRVATLTIAGQIVAGTAFDPARIAERYWEIVQMDDPWQAEFRFTGE